MFPLQPADLSPVRECHLAWRWTDQKWNLLPVTELSQIHSVRADKAAELESMVFAAVTPLPLRIACNTSSVLVDLSNRGLAEICVAADIAESVVEDWLTNRLSDCDVCVSWDRDTAVVCPAKLFVRYWSDFCYPSSDDAVIFPAACDWFLYWHHEEQFFFGRTRDCVEALRIGAN